MSKTVYQVEKDKELQRRMMKKDKDQKPDWKKAAVLLCIALLMGLAGCGGERKQTEAAAEYAQPAVDEPAEETAADGTSAETEGAQAAQEESGEGGSEAQTEGGSGAAAEDTSGSGELEGYVMSVDESNKFVTVDRICTEAEPETGGVLAYNTGEMIRVYFQDGISYTLEVITDGGGNVERTAADFSTIREGDMLRLKGKRAVSEQSGDEFLSSEVVIVRVE